jgi:D12 class N6 adenine-specific DNA methyltransferase
MRIGESSERALRKMQAAGLWNGCFNGRESSIQQLAPFVGKLKTGIVHSLIDHFSREGDWVCDPFSGCGVVPLEAVLLGRKALANDLSPYAICLTLGKLGAPRTLERAEARCEELIRHVERSWRLYDLRAVDLWVRSFFHPKTLQETLAAFEFCREQGDWFLAACLCGILHHQRPGFLSHPASHMVPYLRTNRFPPDTFPELYQYRSLADRLKKKVKRAYRRTHFSNCWTNRDYEVTTNHAAHLSFGDNSVDLVLTSPPYYDALDYARDNRLRLWFLGQTDWRELRSRLTTCNKRYEEQMGKCLKEMHRILKPGKVCILIVGEVQRNGKTRDTGSVLGTLAQKVTSGGFSLDCVVDETIPDVRRSRRRTATTRAEKILVLHKRAKIGSVGDAADL